MTPHEKVEAGAVDELGRISAVIHGGAKTGNSPQRGVASGTETAQMRIADDDAAAASIRAADHLKAADAQQNVTSEESSAMRPETVAEFVKAIREKIAKFLELLEQVANGHFTRSNLAKYLAQTNANIESGTFSPAQVAQEALKILPFRDIDPEEALYLLQNN